MCIVSKNTHDHPPGMVTLSQRALCVAHLRSGSDNVTPLKLQRPEICQFFEGKKHPSSKIATCGFGSFGSAGFIYKGEHHYGVTSGFQIANPS